MFFRTHKHHKRKQTMSFHLFAKRVYDEDLCFVRDLVEIASAMTSVTSLSVIQQIINGIVKKYSLEAKLQELNDNGHYIIEDSYPVDIKKKMDRASELLSISKKLPISTEETVQITYCALTCVKKMKFSYDEKVQLIKTNLITLTENSQLNDFLIQQYLYLL